MSIEEAEDDDSIFEDGSFQFIVNSQTFNQSKKSMEDETKSSQGEMRE